MAELKYVEGDLFAAIDSVSRPTKIAHVCNNGGVWGAGFVVPLGSKFPESYRKYIELHREFSASNVMPLGRVQHIHVRSKPDIWVCNMIAQTLGCRERPLYYNHLCRCMDHVASARHLFVGSEVYMLGDFQIYAPLFGAGLAGGDWRVISALVEDCWVRAGIDVTIFHLPGWRPDGV